MQGKEELPMMQDPPQVTRRLPSKFAQLYIYDIENEVSNRIQAVRKSIQNFDIKKLHTEIAHELKMMLDEYNVLVKSFRMKVEVLKPEDRPDILCTIFKVKLNQLIKDLRQNKIFGKVKVGEDIDNIISAKIPNEANDPKYYAAVKNLMMHGPCGRNSPCMLDGRCTKHFPKRYVVPHNRYLLLKYGAHIIVKWCNQSRCIKYLFKYFNNGHYRVAATFYGIANDGNVHGHMDEINMYYDCKCISPCEAAWRIFGFDIHYKDPPVERLNFHLPNEQNIVFQDTDSIDAIMNRNTMSNLMF
ncbi:hypothetical protein FEM48_Zijuj08G0190800 [Ziziphus jujuba var. spinosa]|uniref:Uncharacterized protein n=1 Tax=Ziziphus jujuba var. spinosa TaxID=714518 RepID=A0A978V0U6_ZIZJJ|nr:hypothetical protein FEM48_Zijuj08G0190800 [Ziziphus jujuba var. spinosa]